MATNGGSLGRPGKGLFLVTLGSLSGEYEARDADEAWAMFNDAHSTLYGPHVQGRRIERIATARWHDESATGAPAAFATMERQPNVKEHSARADGQSSPSFIPASLPSLGEASGKHFIVIDSKGERVLVVPPNDGCVGDPGSHVLDIEARTNTRLRNGENPVWFCRLHKDFMDRRDPNDNVSFATYCARRHADKIDFEPANALSTLARTSKSVDFKAICDAVPALQEQIRWLRAAQFNLYKNLFDWFGPAMKDAGYGLQADETPEVGKVWLRGHAAWTALTNLPKMDSLETWQTAGVAAGISTGEVASVDREELVRRIRLWARARPAQHPPNLLPGFAAAEFEPLNCDDGTMRANPAAAAYGLLIENIILGPTPAHGNRFPISTFDCVPVPGDTPSICPNADRKPQPEWLPDIEKRFRSLGLIGDSETIHWVGSQSRPGNVCGCFRAPHRTGLRNQQIPPAIASDATPFLHEYGSDLHWLWGWGQRISDLQCRENYLPSELDWMIFRPDRLAADAMMRFGIEFPTVIGELKEQLFHTEAAFQKLLSEPSDDAREAFADRMESLSHRINVGAELIAERKGMRPKQTPQTLPADSSPALKPKQQRGQPPTYDAAKDAKLETDWKAAKASRSTQKEFCKARGIKLNELTSALTRNRERRNRQSGGNNSSQTMKRRKSTVK